VQGVGPGSLLGGRYVVQRRVAQHSRFERWTADDQTLEREVVLLCFGADRPEASAALDAARRAAGIEEARLVRVLDVGGTDGVAFVVEEPLTGARSLTSVLRDGALPAEEARRIVGEAASALESARVRGLHHQVLTPRSVMRLEDGFVKVRGLATEAALLEAEESSSERASRADTVALVAVAYAGLTGRWPLTGPDSGLEAAPRVVGGVAAPSEVAAGVPADLDLIARHTLNGDTGPLSPGDLAGQIAPWSAIPLDGSPLRQGGGPNRTEPLPREPVTRGVAKPVQEGRASSARTGSRMPATPVGAQRPSGSTVLGMGIGARGRQADIDTETLEPGQYEDWHVDDDPAENEAVGADDGSDSDGRGGGPGRPAALAGAVASGAAAGTAAVAKGVGAAVGAAGSAASSVSSKVGGLARTAADRVAEKSASRAERRQTEHLSDDFFDGRDMRLSETLEESDEQMGPPVPLLGGGRTEPLDREQSKLALLLVGAFVLVAAILGVWGLPRLGSASTAARSTPAVTATASSTPAGEQATPPASATSAPPRQPVAVVAGQAWDPEGDNQEGNASVPRAFDGKPDTMWRSQAYSSAPFGGFGKSGVGLVLDLGQQTDVHEVAVDLRGGSDLTVYVASRLSLDGATKIGTSLAQDGTVTLQAPGGTARGQLVIVWFTKLAPDGEGKFRAQVAEARVS
jgi:hypothetical protein